MAVKQPGLRGEINAVAAQLCLGLFWRCSWRGPSQAGAALSCWLHVLGEYWRDDDNISCCDGNDFIFATHMISSGINSHQDRDCFSGRKKKQKEISR
jgi:hypothetical protein